MKYSLALSLFFSILFYTASPFAKDFDVITMNNGDIHNGVIDSQDFSIKTVLGLVVIPYTDMAELHLSSKPQRDRLLTQAGDIFKGDLEDVGITISRTLDPELPVTIDNISDIHFSRKENHQLDKTISVLVNSLYGDLFSTYFLTESIEITTPDKTISVTSNNIHTIDIDSISDDEETRAQIRTTNGQILQGQLNTKNISLKTAYQQTLTIKAENLSSVTFNIKNEKPYKQTPVKLDWQPQNYFRDQLTDRTMGPELVKLTSETFIRGDNLGDDDEKPAMPITLNAFAIGSHEITFEQYDQFCDDTRRTKPDDQEWGRGSRPVVNVSWNDAVAYTNWLSKKTGKVYRLPTDAEWEYAARAKTTTRFWWDNKSGVAMANCEGCESIWSGEKTAPAGRFPANAYGLYDTAGNVFEWVLDCYHNTFEHAPKDGSAIEKPGCGKRVIRSGAWSFPAKEIRSANRWRDFPTRKSDDTGFRVVRELD